MIPKWIVYKEIRTVRVLFNLFFNKIEEAKICYYSNKLNTDIKKTLTQEYKAYKNGILNIDDIEEIYKQRFYKGSNFYQHDLFKGLIDHSLKIINFMFKKVDDCDTLNGEVFRFLFLAFLVNNNIPIKHAKKAVKVYSFYCSMPFTGNLYENIKEELQKMHVMTVLNVDLLPFKYQSKILKLTNGKTKILGDYGIYEVDSVNDIKRFYLDKYINENKFNFHISTNNIKTVEIPLWTVYLFERVLR